MEVLSFNLNLDNAIAIDSDISAPAYSLTSQ
jgi:hypothetical protein